MTLSLVTHHCSKFATLCNHDQHEIFEAREDKFGVNTLDDRGGLGRTVDGDKR